MRNKMKQTLVFIIAVLFALPISAQYAEPDSIDVDTLREIVVRGDTILRVNDAIRETLKRQGITKISTKSVSDVIGAKATDKILHPFAVKDRKREKKHRRDRAILAEYERMEKAPTFEELLWEAIRQQSIEDGKEPPERPKRKQKD